MFVPATFRQTLAGKKQVFRIREGGRLIKDIIALRGENLEGEPMLRMAMKDGGRCQHQNLSSPSETAFGKSLWPWMRITRYS